MCEYCYNTKDRELLEIICKYRYENPNAYGYPEIAYWTEEIKLNFCPMCGEKFKKEDK